ncbi:hypothetical protein GCM10007884_07380 [Methylobacterium brachythecii]|uniref:DUF2478 domain-containing protein n=1 Tax=Methylobacterium brachythecii TaxID=1176177 RepID=A0ABQ6CZM1_9HYPH|nr:hypothetical protein GCM10007884_07380 [Methylobacterium brachythecii]
MIETRCPRSNLRSLRDLRTGTDYVTEQDLGPGSTACRLIADGIMDACASVQRQILAGCDIVILSKFGKLEAKRTGLVAAFTAAVETETPVLTAVSPTFVEQWSRFAGNLAAYAPPSLIPLNAWWAGFRRPDDGVAEAAQEISMQKQRTQQRFPIVQASATH